MIECEISNQIAINQSTSKATLQTLDGEVDVLVKQCGKSEYFNEFAREIDIVQQLEHENIARMIATTIQHDSVLLLSEASSVGLLSEVLSREIDARVRLRIALDVAIALDYLHSHRPRIVHRNVNPASILVMRLENSESAEVMAKLGNFGSSIRCISFAVADVACDARFAAPEVLCNEKHNHAADVYSFAMTLWSVAAQQIPFESNPANLSELVKSGVRPSLNSLRVGDEIKRDLCGLIEQCWATDANQRPAMSQVVARLAAISGASAK
jgi:serine/threonine protein kinase